MRIFKKQTIFKLIFLLNFVFSIVACSFTKAKITLFGSWTQPVINENLNWTFEFSKQNLYDYDSNYLDYSNDSIQLKEINFLVNSNSLITSGNNLGTSFKTLGSNSGLSLDNAGSCNALDTNCGELNLSWTPGYNSIVHYWKFDNNLNDSIGSSNFTVYGGASFNSSTKKIGTHAIQFDGTNGYADTSDVTTMQFGTGDFSISSWVYRERNLFNWSDSSLLSKWNTGASAGTNEFSLGFSSNGNDNVPAFHIESGTTSYSVFGSREANLNRWINLIAVRSNSTMLLYMDGELVGTQSIGASSVNSIGRNLYIANTLANMYFSQIKVDEVALWKGYALTANDVQVIFKMQSPKRLGRFESTNFDSKNTNSTYNGLKLISNLPAGKELPDAKCSSCLHIKSESSNSYSSIVGSAGTTNDNNLMSGIVGLWHLNEIVSTGGANNDFTDHSGATNNGEKVGNTSFGANGLLGNSAKLIDATSYIDVPDNTTLRMQSFTISFWMKAEYSTTGLRILLKKSSNTTTNNYTIGISDGTYGAAGNIYATATANSVADGMLITTTTKVDDGEWYHVVLTSDGNEGRLYVNNTLSGNNAYTAPLYQGTQNLTLGASANSFIGYLDEVAIWNRKLHVDEIKQLYIRGSTNIKLQVRSCTSLTCNNVTEPWIGSNNDAKSFFSEINNKQTANSLTSYTLNSYLDFLFSSFSLTISPQRYLQYRAYISNQSTDATMDPIISSFGLNHSKYEPTTQSIKFKSAFLYSRWGELTVASTQCTQNFGYNFSTNQTDWYYWDSTKSTDCMSAGSGAWCKNSSNDSSLQTSSAVAYAKRQHWIERNSDAPIYIKMFINSNGNDKCQITQVKME